MDLVRKEGEVIEPFLPWLGRNAIRLAVYLLIASVATALMLTLDPSDGVALSTVVFVGGGLYSLPGATIWILILSFLSPRASVRSRRTIAIVTAPLLIGIIWIFLFWDLSPVLALIYGVLFPAGSGFVVRLRGWSRAALIDTAS